MVLVDGAEDGIDVLVRDGHFDVIPAEKVGEELTEFFPVKELVTIIVILLEVLHHFLSKGGLVTREFLQLSVSLIEFTFGELGLVDHHLALVCLFRKYI